MRKLNKGAGRVLAGISLIIGLCFFAFGLMEKYLYNSSLGITVAIFAICICFFILAAVLIVVSCLSKSGRPEQSLEQPEQFLDLKRQLERRQKLNSLDMDLASCPNCVFSHIVNMVDDSEESRKEYFNTIFGESVIGEEGRNNELKFPLFRALKNFSCTDVNDDLIFSDGKVEAYASMRREVLVKNVIIGALFEMYILGARYNDKTKRLELKESISVDEYKRSLEFYHSELSDMLSGLLFVSENILNVPDNQSRKKSINYFPYCVAEFIYTAKLIVNEIKNTLNDSTNANAIKMVDFCNKITHIISMLELKSTCKLKSPGSTSDIDTQNLISILANDIDKKRFIVKYISHFEEKFRESNSAKIKASGSFIENSANDLRSVLTKLRYVSCIRSSYRDGFLIEGKSFHSFFNFLRNKSCVECYFCSDKTEVPDECKAHFLRVAAVTFALGCKLFLLDCNVEFNKACSSKVEIRGGIITKTWLDALKCIMDGFFILANVINSELLDQLKNQENGVLFEEYCNFISTTHYIVRLMCQEINISGRKNGGEVLTQCVAIRDLLDMVCREASITIEDGPGENMINGISWDICKKPALAIYLSNFDDFKELGITSRHATPSVNFRINGVGGNLFNVLPGEAYSV